MSIFSKLFKLFITVVLMPLIPMALLLGYYQSRQKATILENHYNLAEIVSSELHHYVAELDGHLAFVPALTAALPQLAEITAVLQQALGEDAQWKKLMVFAPNGTALAYASAAPDDITPLVPTLVPANAQDMRVQARLVGKDKEIVLAFSYPLLAGYWLYGEQTLPDLLDRLAQMRIGKTGQIYLANAQGQIFTAPYQDNPQVPAAVLAAQFHKSTPLIDKLKSGQGRLVGAISSEPRLGMYTVVLQPKAEALRSLYFSNWTLLLFVLSIAMLAYFGALAFARSVGEPIAQLIEGAQAVSRGDLAHRVPEQTDWGELKALIISFNKMIADLQDYQALQLKNQISEMKEQVFRAVAHDLRAPLVGLQGYIYLLASESDPQKQKEYIASMSEAAANLSSLLEDVLAVSRVEAGVSLPQREKLLLAPVLTSILRTLQPQAQSKQLNITSTVADDLTVWADPKLLRRILSNLLSNAIKFTKAGFVKINAVEQDNHVCITVQDSGIGMTPQQCDTVFEKFKQADSQSEGYGLGLFISRQLARAHGGDLTVSSVPGQGSTFTLCLPKEEK